MPPKTPAAAPERRMDLRRIGYAGQARDEALALADAKLDEVVDEVQAAGRLANIALAARIGGVSRDVIYKRLRQRAEEENPAR